MKEKWYIKLWEKTTSGNFSFFLFLLILGAALKLMYLFGSPLWRRDLLFFIQGARTMLDGCVLYRDIGDIKPPGIFFLFYIMGLLFGYSNILISIKGLALAFQTIAAFFFFKTGASIRGRKYGVMLGVLFVVAVSIHWQFCKKLDSFLHPI